LRAEISQALAEVLEAGVFVGGGPEAAFERDFADFCGARHAVAVASGTEALTLTLRALGIGPGDEVLTVPNTFMATAEAICLAGAQPRFVDVRPDTANMDPGLLEAAVTPRTRAIIPVHLYGYPADLGPITALARSRGLKVIADAAHAHGARYQGRSICAWGDASAFSFYPTKNLGAFGEAGAVVTDDARLAADLGMLRDHGRRERYVHEVIGTNARMDAMQAAVLAVKLRHLRAGNERRRVLAALYDQLLPGVSKVGPAAPVPGTQGVHHLYVIRTQGRDALQQRLTAAGIESFVHYPIALHRQPAFAYLGLAAGAFPVAERLAGEILSLPMHPGLSEEQIAGVAEQVRAADQSR
jgi:dTDP-4-amino-4,6-dideoxygalactose transaminase